MDMWFQYVAANIIALKEETQKRNKCKPIQADTCSQKRVSLSEKDSSQIECRKTLSRQNFYF